MPGHLPIPQHPFEREGYADDAVLGFQHRDVAERFLEQRQERLRKFGLELHPDKTRLCWVPWVTGVPTATRVA